MEKISNKVDTNSAWLWSLKPKYFFVSISGICLHLYIRQSIHSIILVARKFLKMWPGQKKLVKLNECYNFPKVLLAYILFSESKMDGKQLKKPSVKLNHSISRVFWA